MNERIIDLYEQASSFASEEENPTKSYKDRVMAKFAELIVRECVDIASQEDFDVMMKEGYPCRQTAKKIRKHFGVEE